MLKQWLTAQQLRWVSARIPASPKIVLNRHNIFILPTGFGLAFGLCCIFLFVLGINYQNNLIIILSLLLSSVGITTIIMTHKNVSGVTLSKLVIPEYFAAQSIAMPCQISAKTTRYGIKLSLDDHDTQVESVDDSSTVEVPIGQRTRGRHRLNRISVASVFPFGLFRAWSRVDLDIEIVVFPQPLAIDIALYNKEDQGEQSSQTVRGNGDEFYGLDTYRQGESLKRVAWKQVAQGRGMLTKQFEQQAGEAQWLDFEQVAGDSLEQKISHLCYLVIEYNKQKQQFGLILPNQVLKVGYGESHRTNALTMLALYGLGDE